jgi:glutathione gamma-glutamylcysteinyltransferase
MNRRVLRTYRWLAPHLQAQEHPCYGGLATAATMLNALNSDQGDGPTSWSQELLAGLIAARSALCGSLEQGMDLTQLCLLLRTCGVIASHHTPSSERLASFRSCLMELSCTARVAVAVCYQREAVGQRGGRHISPVGGWHHATDEVLVLDTAAHLYPYTWVRVETMFKAMRGDPSSRDEDSLGWLVCHTLGKEDNQPQVIENHVQTPSPLPTTSDF